MGEILKIIHQIFTFQFLSKILAYIQKSAVLVSVQLEKNYKQHTHVTSTLVDTEAPPAPRTHPAHTLFITPHQQ